VTFATPPGSVTSPFCGLSSSTSFFVAASYFSSCSGVGSLWANDSSGVRIRVTSRVALHVERSGIQIASVGKAIPQLLSGRLSGPAGQLPIFEVGLAIRTLRLKTLLNSNMRTAPAALVWILSLNLGNSVALAGDKPPLGINLHYAWCAEPKADADKLKRY
jgi:hypothetical protein